MVIQIGSTGCTTGSWRCLFSPVFCSWFCIAMGIIRFLSGHCGGLTTIALERDLRFLMGRDLSKSVTGYTKW